jgi:hypothetical protein
MHKKNGNESQILTQFEVDMKSWAELELRKSSNQVQSSLSTEIQQLTLQLGSLELKFDNQFTSLNARLEALDQKKVVIPDS